MKAKGPGTSQRSVAAKPKAPTRHKNKVWQATNNLMLGVIGANTVAPLAHAILPDAHPHRFEGQTRQVVTEVQRDVEHVVPHGLEGMGPFDARDILADVPTTHVSPLLISADAKLQKADQALGLPAGSVKELAVAALTDQLGASDGGALSLAHKVALAEKGSVAARAALEAWSQVEDKPAAIAKAAVVTAALADRLAADRHLATAFAIGYIAVPESFEVAAQPAIAGATALWQAINRHQSAIEHLKHLQSGNSFFDDLGLMAGTLAELLTAGISAYGPSHVIGVGTSVARGANLVLALGEGMLAQTAFRGTEKTVTNFTHLPEETAAFFAGVLASAAQNSVEQNTEAGLTHLAQTRADMKGAVDSGDPAQVGQAIKHSFETMTPAERIALNAVVRSIAEHLVVAAAR